MSSLIDEIRTAVREERFLFSIHADERIRDRRLAGWQVVAGVEEALVLAEHPRNTPHPLVDMELLLPDGTRCKAVWAWIPSVRTAKLVTVFFDDR